MPTSPQDREQIRLAVLRYLDAAADASPGRGISTAVLRQHLVSDGFQVDEQVTEASLQYLFEKGLVSQASKAISPEMRSWRITAQGRDEYASLSS